MYIALINYENLLRKVFVISRKSHNGTLIKESFSFEITIDSQEIAKRVHSVPCAHQPLLPNGDLGYSHIYQPARALR